SPTLEQIVKQWPDDVRLVELMNPLPFHKSARPAAIAALAAQQQQRYWDFRDLLFASDQHAGLEDAALAGYARQLGMDAVRFKLALEDAALAAEVDRQQDAAVALGATGTPTSFINGQKIAGAQPFEKFAELVQAELDASVAANRRGDAWVEERTKAANAALAGYLYQGIEPPRPQAEAEEDAPKVDETVWRVTVDASDPSLGDPSAPVTVVEFSEFQCPFCARVKPTLAALKAKYGDKVRLVFKHNPLPFHDHAMDAAKAAVCAQKQGKFWEMHDLLFDNQRALEPADLRGYAQQAGLDLKAWDRCVKDKATEAKIKADQALAGAVTARGTPTSFVNGMRLAGAQPLDAFAAVVDTALARRDAQVPAGTAPEKAYDAIVGGGKVFSVLEEEVNTFDTKGRPRLGKAGKVEITVFSDFQCPFCSRAAAPLADLVKKYRGKVSVVYKHFPLSFHVRAMPAARYAVCAEAQGRFWELHDLMFDNQKALEDEDLAGYARQARLDAKKLEACLAAPATDALIDADMAEARAAGVRGTPTFYLNGRKFSPPGGYNVESFSTAIDALLAGKNP
ncbi:MAG: thioredoxin domain-containing protein, partial [Myxococcales bacterium]|nr:thioredoxin domain-containing protein [Myxococcales bacterium]